MRLLITPGEPAGVGPDITVNMAKFDWSDELAVIADPDLLLSRAQLLGIPLTLLPINIDAAPKPQKAGTLSIIPQSLRAPVQIGELNVQNAAYVFDTLNLATDWVLAEKAAALVTGPVHKGIMNTAGIPFTGHTEFFANASHVKHTVMLFVVDQLKVALLTTHLPLAAVPKAITKERILTTLQILDEGFKRWFKLAAPKILVTGLNPHAGEGGYLGREELDIITPALHAVKNLYPNLMGPLPADTIFTEAYLKEADVILAMYHDQALPVVKYMGFDRAVNVTLGLPFLRTSVDHGTALSIAGTNKVSASSMFAAIQLAIKVTNNDIFSRA